MSPTKTNMKLRSRMPSNQLTKRLHALQSEDLSGNQSEIPKSELRVLLHDLEIYQIELEMQNRELRDSQAALEESQDRYANLFDFAPSGYVTLTDHGLMHEVNLTVASMLGVERHWLLGRPLAAFVWSSDLPNFRDHLLKCRSTGESVVTRLFLVKKNKDILPSELTSTVSIDPETGALLFRTTLLDLTDRNKLETSLKEAVQNLERERDLRESFVSALTHDLRTPLTAAKIGAQLLFRKSDAPLEVVRISEKIVTQINRVDQMIQNLLDANRIRAGEQIPMDFSEFDLNLLVKRILSEFTLSFGDRFRLNSTSPVFGSWCQTEMQRVIENLLDNAIKYGDPERPIELSVFKSDEQNVTVSVHNFGSPISPSELGTLFEQFRRTISSENGDKKGWGIGLTLVRGIIAAHRGEVTVESSLEKGTTFRVSIPFQQK